jgi:hypothetical protein
MIYTSFFLIDKNHMIIRPTTKCLNIQQNILARNIIFENFITGYTNLILNAGYTTKMFFKTLK